MMGSQLGKWVIDRELGRGGMGRVYLAHVVADGQVAAVKVLAAELAQEAGFLQRFQREISALSQLDHPNIVRFYESGNQDNVFYFAMEYVDGPNFEFLLQQRNRLPWKEVLDAALQVCPALKHAHDHGIIHRDLKPSNLLRSREGQVKLGDFGIARVFASNHLTATGGVVGTAEYLSPEQAMGKPATKRSDLYSLGIVLYQFLTGRPPFEGTSTPDLLRQHCFGQFDRPAKVVPGLPYELDEVICQLLEKDPANRPADGLVLLRRLETIRRKLERRDQPTNPGLYTAQTMADNEEAEVRSSEEGPATLMSRLMRRELKQMKDGGPLSQWFNKPWVLLPLFLLCVAGIVWGFFLRPKPTTSEPAEARETPSLARERLAQRLAMSNLRDSAPVSEAQRFYQRGVQFCKQGDADAARRVWHHLVQSFRGVEAEQRWVELAEEGIQQLDRRVPARDPLDESVRTALQRARQLNAQGDREGAEAIWQGLEGLYGQDPAGAEVMKQLRRDRGR
jgi:serine/threonine-protein kinase